MSKSLIKLLDNALLPAALMVVSKFIGIVFTINLFNIEWVMYQTPNNVFSFQTVLSSQDVLTVTSYSDLIMFTALAIGFSFNVIRAVYLHNSHITPDLLNRLANRNLLGVIKNSYEIYHSASVWLVFTWITCLMVVGNALAGITFGWIGLAAFVLTTLVTIIFFQDIYKELEDARQHPGKYLNS